VDVGRYASAVRTNFGALFDALLFGITDDVAVDHLPGPIADNLDIAVQGRLFKSFFSNTSMALPAKALLVDNVKGQFFIREIEKESDDDTTKHLFGTHVLGAGAPGIGLALV
jgi:hypothetical protein